MRRPAQTRSRALLGLLAVALAVLIPTGIWAVLRPVPSTATPTPTPTAAPAAGVLAEIEELHARLESADEDRLELERAVARLERDVQGLETLLAGLPDVVAEPEAEVRVPETGVEEAPARGRRASREDEPFFDETLLADAGYGGEHVERLRARFEQAELDQLYLRDAATREGWMRSQRYRDEREALRQSAQSDLGERDYRGMLYAAGRPNALEIRHILQDSAAQSAGLQAGDVLLTYSDQAVFTLWGLRGLTSQGEAGQQILVEVSREGLRMTFALPRGPLGARLNTKRVLPTELP